MYGKFQEFLTAELADIQAAGLYKNERIITTEQRADIKVRPDSDVLNFLREQWEVLSCPSYTFSAIKPSHRIDYILALKNGARYTVVGSEVPVDFKSGDVKIASDHLPVYVDVKLF